MTTSLNNLQFRQLRTPVFSIKLERFIALADFDMDILKPTQENIDAYFYAQQLKHKDCLKEYVRLHKIQRSSLARAYLYLTQTLDAPKGSLLPKFSTYFYKSPAFMADKWLYGNNLVFHSDSPEDKVMKHIYARGLKGEKISDQIYCVHAESKKYLSPEEIEDEMNKFYDFV